MHRDSSQLTFGPLDLSCPATARAAHLHTEKSVPEWRGMWVGHLWYVIWPITFTICRKTVHGQMVVALHTHWRHWNCDSREKKHYERWTIDLLDSSVQHHPLSALALIIPSHIPVKTGSSRSGTDERGKCDNVGLSAACPSNEATIRSVVVVVAWAKADRVREWLRTLSCVRQHESTRVRVEPEGFGIGNEDDRGQRERRTEIREVS